MKKNIIIVSSVCLVIAIVVATLAIAQPKGYAAVGRDARKMYEQYQKRASQDSDVGTSDEAGFWFPVPDGYLDIKSDDKKYVSDINMVDTPEQWAALEDADKMREVSQIPENILSIVSTEELLLYCMNYNLIADVFAFNTIDDGKAELKENFNGVQELLKRKDAADCLIKLYKLYDLNDQQAKDTNCCIRFHYLESLICYSEIFGNLTAAQANELAVACAQKINEMVSAEEALFSPDISMLIAARCQYSTSEDFRTIIDASPAAKQFIEDGIILDEEISDSTIGEIVSYFEPLSKSNNQN